MKRLGMMLAAAGLFAGWNGFAAEMSGTTEILDLPKVAGIEQSMRASDLEMRGDLARAHKNYYQAEAYYRSALRLDARNWAVYNKLGIIEIRQGEYPAAHADFQRALKWNPKDAHVLNNLGAVACLQKKYKPAAKYLKQALALDETDATFHVNLGEAWMGLNKIDRAMTEYARALELDGDIFSNMASEGVTAQLRTPEQQARVSYLIAKAYAKRGNIEGALDYLRRAKENGYPDLGTVYQEKEFAALWQDARLSKLVPR